ncbi:DNA mismatch repair protein MutT [Phyllobacterium phragmitis]|uniref:DNA mismatch repair protein MutT n=2 Tax=Phyllobacterium phragmitis TaxID=2670329 RepID=A0A2S9IKQ3_9HYPH|nr:NUDIX hydrolase [Phyllobacterium phragmitis]PRD41113.1 DNA mismatch repair protein MutT [Phyllobacterium phragmitis]
METSSGRLRQVAALVYRYHDGRLEVLLITSRRTGRWVLPKGWPQVGRTLSQAALREAYEEAGVRGAVATRPLGSYAYEKTDLPPEANSAFTVDVFSVRFSHQEKKFPERGEREDEWVTPEEAAERVDEPELKSILRTFGAAQNMAAE